MICGRNLKEKRMLAEERRKYNVCLSEIFRCKLLVVVLTTDCGSMSVLHSVSKVEFASNNLERLIVAVGVLLWS